MIKLPNLRTLGLSHNGLKDIRPLASLGFLEHLQLVGISVDKLRQSVTALRCMVDLVALDMRDAANTRVLLAEE